MKMTNREFKHAMNVIESFVLPKAIQHLGITWAPFKDAPNTYKSLRSSYDRLGIFLVSNSDCENTIYSKPIYNMMFRAWHDYTHYHYKLSFSKNNEIMTGMIQMDLAQSLLETIGASKRLIENVKSILRVDIIGQVQYYYEYGHYVPNQYQFTTGLLVNKVA